MKIIIESEILKKLVQPSLIEILFFLKDQKKLKLNSPTCFIQIQKMSGLPWND
jgi:hypothetical protein